MKQISLIPVFIVLLGLVMMLALFYNGNKISERVAFMQGQNDKLKEQNDSLKSQINQLNLKIEASNVQIQLLNEEDYRLREVYKTAQNQINRLKPKYDKANNFTRNFNADSIRIYFSNLQ